MTEEVHPPKKPKEKKGIMGGLLSKKAKPEHKANPKEHKEEPQLITKNEHALYIQLESFLPLSPPDSLPELQTLMALVLVLARRVQQDMGQWPVLIPVIT